MLDTYLRTGPGGVGAVKSFNERERPAGTKFYYASVETQVLGLVLARAIGRPVAEYLEQKIWRPIGAEANATWLIDNSGQEATYCCLNAVLRDYARLGLLLAHDGNWRGRQIIPAAWVLDATTVHPDKPHLWPGTVDIGLRTLRLGVDTHAITSHFAIPLLIKTPGGLVVEVTDGTDAYNATNYRVSFFYDLAKAAVNRMAFALAHELQPYGATALSLTPGWLRSEAMLDAYAVTESNWQDATTRSPHFAITESPAFVGRAVAALAQDPNVSRWNGKSLSSGELAKIYGFTDLDGSQPDAWRYVVEVQDAGKPADVTGYR